MLSRGPAGCRNSGNSAELAGLCRWEEIGIHCAAARKQSRGLVYVTKHNGPSRSISGRAVFILRMAG